MKTDFKKTNAPAKQQNSTHGWKSELKSNHNTCWVNPSYNWFDDIRRIASKRWMMDSTKLRNMAIIGRRVYSKEGGISSQKKAFPEFQGIYTKPEFRLYREFFSGTVSFFEKKINWKDYRVANISETKLPAKQSKGNKSTPLWAQSLTMTSMRTENGNSWKKNMEPRIQNIIAFVVSRFSQIPQIHSICVGKNNRTERQNEMNVRYKGF